MLVFLTGFSSNDAILQCLLRQIPGCRVIVDEKTHSSIINGIRVMPTEQQLFQHNDVAHLEQIFARYPLDRSKIVVFGSVHPMDGNVTPIADVVGLAKRHNALTCLDEVYAAGLYGPHEAGQAAQISDGFVPSVSRRNYSTLRKFDRISDIRQRCAGYGVAHHHPGDAIVSGYSCFVNIHRQRILNFSFVSGLVMLGSRKSRSMSAGQLSANRAGNAPQALRVVQAHIADVDDGAATPAVFRQPR